MNKKYYKLTKDWSITCGSVTNWNDFNIYSKLGLSKSKDCCSREIDNESEYVLRGENSYIYVNKDKHYEITNFKGEFKDNHKLYEVSFDFVKYLGKTPTYRIIIISGYDYCIYALGREYWKLVENTDTCFGNRPAWILDRREVISPITEKMYSQVKCPLSTKKTYRQYLAQYKNKLKELKIV